MIKGDYFLKSVLLLSLLLSPIAACPSYKPVSLNGPLMCKRNRAPTAFWRIEGSKLSLRTIAKDLPPLHTFKTLEIFCSGTISLDKDLQLPGIDLIMMAPKWKIDSPVIIDLSGKDGAPGESDGLDGLPGGHGQNGGHFIGKAKTIVQGTSGAQLTIKVNGGNGGKGGDGSHGTYERCGVDGEKAKVLERNQSVLAKRTKLGYDDGKLEYILEAFATFNDRFHAEYTSGTPGEDGEDGGRPGRGGDGGYAGQVKIVTEEKSKQLIKIEGYNGIKGEDGRPGKPGKGGRGARIYTGVYLEAISCPSLRGYTEEINPTGATFASTVTLAQTLINISAQRAAKNAIYRIAAETAKQAAAQIMKGTAMGLGKQATKGMGKEMVKTIINKAGQETLKKAGGSFIKGSVTSVVTGTTGGTLQNVVRQGAVRGIARAASSELGKVGVAAGTGAFSLASTASSFGLNLLVASGLSILHEKLRSDWHTPVQELETEDGRDGSIPTELNDLIIEEPLKEKENLNVLLALYMDYLLE